MRRYFTAVIFVCFHVGLLLAETEPSDIDGLLHRAVLMDDSTLMASLLTNGLSPDADCDFDGNPGRPSLHVSVMAGSTNVLETLIESGANRLLMDDFGMLAIDLATGHIGELGEAIGSILTLDEDMRPAHSFRQAVRNAVARAIMGADDRTWKDAQVFVDGQRLGKEMLKAAVQTTKIDIQTTETNTVFRVRTTSFGNTGRSTHQNRGTLKLWHGYWVVILGESVDY
jgi:hypothetical protein